MGPIEEAGQQAYPDTGLTARRLLKSAREWMAEQTEPVDDRLWAEVYRISQQGKSQRTRLMASRLLADRIDPAPRAPAVEVSTGPVTITWQSSSSPTPRAPSSSGSTTPSTGIAPALRASSATDVLANL